MCLVFNFQHQKEVYIGSRQSNMGFYMFRYHFALRNRRSCHPGRAAFEDVPTQSPSGHLDPRTPGFCMSRLRCDARKLSPLSEMESWKAVYASKNQYIFKALFWLRHQWSSEFAIKVNDWNDRNLSTSLTSSGIASQWSGSPAKTTRIPC